MQFTRKHQQHIQNFWQDVANNKMHRPAMPALGAPNLGTTQFHPLTTKTANAVKNALNGNRRISVP